MGDPTTMMAAIGMGAQVAGGVTKAFGDLWGGAATGKMYKYQAGVAQARARVDEQNAIFAERAGEENALYQGMRGRFALGNIRAGQGASNISTASPSSTAVRAGQTYTTQLAESQTRTNAARRAFGFRTEEASDIASAGALSTASATARTASYFSAGASVLGAAGSVADKWTQYSANFGDNSQAGPPRLYNDPNNPGGFVAGYG